jgi:hypothetical protein
VLSTAALAIGRVASGKAQIAPNGDPVFVRPPAQGQTWQYAKHDLVTGAMVDTLLDRVPSAPEPESMNGIAALDEAIPCRSWPIIGHL